jgi:hypothetical protein
MVSTRHTPLGVVSSFTYHLTMVGNVAMSGQCMNPGKDDCWHLLTQKWLQHAAASSIVRFCSPRARGKKNYSRLHTIMTYHDHAATLRESNVGLLDDLPIQTSIFVGISHVNFPHRWDVEAQGASAECFARSWHGTCHFPPWQSQPASDLGEVKQDLGWPMVMSKLGCWGQL